MVLYPVFGASPEDEARALPPYGQPVPGAKTELPQEVGRQGYLVLAAYGAHRFFILARLGKIRRCGLADSNTPGWLGLVLHPLHPSPDFTFLASLCQG